MHSSLALAVLGLFTLASGCARLGPLGAGLGETLARDTAYARSQSHETVSAVEREDEIVGEGIALPEFPAVLYRRQRNTTRAPAVVFLPGRFAPEDQYESYGRALAARGFIVIVRGRYSWFYPDADLADDAVILGDWLIARADVDPARLAVVGHSMGGRDAIRAAAQDPRFAAVVAIEPGTIAKLPNGADVTSRLVAPLLLIGADEAYKGWEFCGRRGSNYATYFDSARDGTIEVEIHGADHVQVMDSPDAFGYGVCRVGSADSMRVRTLARSATVQFLAKRFQNGPDFVEDSSAFATTRVRTRTAAVSR